jgi:hypothetical protein
MDTQTRTFWTAVAGLVTSLGIAIIVWVNSYTDPPPPPPPAPTATLAVNPTEILVGESTVATWTSTGASTASLDGQPVALNGSQTFTPAEAHTYTLVASNAGGSFQAQATVNVLPQPPPPPPPAGGDLVVAHGQTITLTQDVEYDDITLHGSLALDPTKNINLRCINLHWHGGHLVMTPNAGVTQSIIGRDVPLDPADTEQEGNGLVAHDGKITLRGQFKTPYVRTAGELAAGQLTFSLASVPVNWQVGDKLVIPQSAQWFRSSYPFVASTEEAYIAAIDGATVTLQAPLAHAHPGARNGDGVVEYLPHINNLTRNAVVRSENPSGTRWHCMFSGSADVDIQNCEFRSMGRTTNLPGSLIARYCFHLHHFQGVTQPNGYQFTFTGNSVWEELASHNFRWGLTIHDAHYGKVADNVVYNWAGSGIVTEDGSETGNVIERNITIKTRGHGDRLNGGNEGQGFWFRGTNNYVRDNVSADNFGDGVEAAYGYKYFMYYLGNVRIPNYPGANTAIDGQYTLRNGNEMPVLEFARNEVYGSDNGLTCWWLNAEDTTPKNGGESIFKDTTVWHTSHWGFYGYPMADVTFDGWIAI